MRRIVITLTENPSREEVEAFIDAPKVADATERENSFTIVYVKLLTAIAGRAALGVSHDFKGGKTENDLRTEARVQADIRKAGR